MRGLKPYRGAYPWKWKVSNRGRVNRSVPIKYRYPLGPRRGFVVRRARNYVPAHLYRKKFSFLSYAVGKFRKFRASRFGRKIFGQYNKTARRKYGFGPFTGVRGLSHGMFKDGWSRSARRPQWANTFAKNGSRFFRQSFN